MQLDNIREVIGEDKITKFFTNRHINQKLVKDIPDGVYDDDSATGWRLVYINGTLMYIICAQWIQKGGPSDLPDVISKPEFGHYPRLP
jgi:hypothetical protein